MSTPADFQAFFTNIKPRPSSGSASSTPASEGQQQYRGQSPAFHSSQGYHPPTVSSPLYSPPANGTPPHHASDIISPHASTPRNDQNRSPSLSTDRTSSLLSLLKFSQPTTTSSTPRPQVEEVGYGFGMSRESQGGQGNVGVSVQSGHGRGISASDLVASFMAKPTASAPAVSGSGSPTAYYSRENPAERLAAVSTSAENAQDMLLRLLNRPNTQTSNPGESLKMADRISAFAGADKRPPLGAGSKEASFMPGRDEPVVGSMERKPSPMRLFGSGTSGETTPFEAPQQQKPVKDTIFTYVNPFEQLAAASPRNRTPQGNKARSGPGSPAIEILKAKRNGSQVSNKDDKRQQPLNFSSKSGITPLPSELEVNIPTMQPSNPQAEPASTKEQESKVKKVTVPKALEEIADQVDKEVEEALARAVREETVYLKQESEDENVKDILDTLAESLQKSTVEVEGELENETDTGLDSKELPQTLHEGAKEGVEDTANGGLADSWESETERIIPVYNFLLKPFVSITWKGTTDTPAGLRDDGIMEIARLKKEFDQLDRSLTSATSEYIVYALVKNGGMRIIRQDDGCDKQVFRSNHDRIFNVSLCGTAVNSPATKDQAVLGIGVSGAVYWATISKPDDDLFERDALESESLIFPPFPASDENTSGGQLKTRARRSSRHPEFFAIGRGKSIHVVWPHLAMSPKYGVTASQRKVDTEKFFKERSLKIATGKAGKDFVFSDDDTVIVSLDKTGRMRFWDIREMGGAPTMGVSKATSLDIRAPLLTLVTGSPSEKSWPTSVLFIDKLRPYVKEFALRYVLVGLKQNHTLQLWDIGLGKAVQELNFPHENESDAICSVAYHPGSGIIVVGHPTRNSIYFVHLSAPRYTLSPMSQGAYIQSVAEKDERLPKPESTACMSGIRELSFGFRGQLRSLELLPLTRPSTQRGVDEQGGLFELYVMHSRGVTCLNIKKADLGWSIDNKILQPVDALEKGYIEIKELQSFPTQIEDQSAPGDGILRTATNGNGKESVRKAAGPKTESLPGSEPFRTQSPSKHSPKKKAMDSHSIVDQPEQPGNIGDKNEKKKKKKAINDTLSKLREATGSAKLSHPVGEVAEYRNPTSPRKITLPGIDTNQHQFEKQPSSELSRVSVAVANNQNVLSPRIQSAAAPSEAINLGISSDFLNKEVKKIEKAVSLEFSKALNRELDALYHRINEDKRAQDEAATAKQDAILRLISSTLSDNVEKNLSRIITGNIQSMVVPALANVTTASMDRQIKETLLQHLESVIPPAISSVLPDVIASAVQSPDVLRAISDPLTGTITSLVEGEFSRILRNTIVPAFKAESIRSAEKMTREAEQRFAARLKQHEVRQQNDTVKIDQLTTLVRTLSETVSTMATAQSEFQNEILELNRRLGSRQVSPQHSSMYAMPGREHHPVQPTAEEIELAEISQLMAERKYEEASMRWLQSSQQADLFNHLFVTFDPSYLSGLSPLVALSVSAAVTSSLETNVMDRLNWLQHVFQTVDVRDPDISEVTPKIMDVLIQRLEGLYMAIAENTPHDPVLRKIPPLTRWARDLRAVNTMVRT